MEQVISFLVGVLAPFIISFLNKWGISGVKMLWIVYALSVIASIAVNFLTGTLDLTNVTASVVIINATASTIFHGIIKE